MLKQYKITQNGFIFIYENGIRLHSFFYHNGDEKIWEESGYTAINR